MESNQQILKISNQLFSKLPELLKYFGIDFIEYPNRYAFACPIHGGDNTEGCCVFSDGNSVKGNWNCWTNHCEDDHGRNLFGFVKGVLSNKAGGNTNIYETVKFCMDFLGLDDSELKQIKSIDSNNDLKLLEVFNRDPERSTPVTDRESIILIEVMEKRCLPNLMLVFVIKKISQCLIELLSQSTMKAIITLGA